MSSFFSAWYENEENDNPYFYRSEKGIVAMTTVHCVDRLCWKLLFVEK